ncbi:hypothetical protein DUD79_22170 [Priestia aryabhattai]
MAKWCMLASVIVINKLLQETYISFFQASSPFILRPLFAAITKSPDYISGLFTLFTQIIKLLSFNCYIFLLVIY